MARFTGGWYKVHRNLLEKDIADNMILFSLWHMLLYMATWKSTQILWEGKQRNLPPGSVVFGVKELAERWACSRSVIKKWLRHLHNTQRIVLETCPRGSLVTICNWEVYQGLEDDGVATTELQRAHNVPTTWPQRATYKESTIKKEEGRNSNTYRRSRQTPQLTQQQTPPNQEPPVEAEVQSKFEEHYEAYPRRSGDQNKKRGMATCEKNFKTEDKKAALLTAIKNYKAYVVREGKEGSPFVKQFATFVNGAWEEWVKPPEYQASMFRPNMNEDALQSYANQLLEGQDDDGPH